MITWLTLWPFTLIPFLITFALGLLPQLNMFGKPVGGGYVREWFLNNTVLPLMSDSMALEIIQWFKQASYIEEISLHALFSLNVFALFFPLMFILGTGIINAYTWYSKTALQQKHTLLNK